MIFRKELKLVQIAVTTSQDEPLLIQQAQAVARELVISYIPRRRKSLAKLRLEENLDYLLIVEKQRVILKGATTFFWHPSMAVPRLKALREGKPDPMVEALGLKPGYTVLDCTLGLAADALVSAYAVGPEGHVIGLEASPYIAFITRWGLEHFSGQNTHIMETIPRISVINQNHADYLRVQEMNSFDVVYFDPMFQHGFKDSQALNALRPLAAYQRITEDDIQQALRVSRTCVVMKETARGMELAKLKAQYVMGGRYSPVAYGVWKKA